MEVLSELTALVLAAGKGTRMRSKKPKVLQEILGQTLIWYVHTALERLMDKRHIWTVVGHESQALYDLYPDMSTRFIYQDRQLGTGHALQCSYSILRENGYSWCLIVNGDTPLFRPESLFALFERAKSENADLAFITMFLDDPTGYGRIVRDESGSVSEIIEEKDIYAQRSENGKINEVNTGVYCLNLETMGDYLHLLTNENEQKEYYLPQLIEICREYQAHVVTSLGQNSDDYLGVNNPKELLYCEELMQRRIIEEIITKGAILHQPSLIRVGPEVECSPSVEITGPCELYGRCQLDPGSRVESHVWLKDSSLGSGSTIHSFSHINGSEIGKDCQIGPYARLRPGTKLSSTSKVGNFVEIKKAILDQGCKVNHLSYIGDAHIGEETNVGAGTITCNYDGSQKHQTNIGKHVFIGSNSSLVAPLTIGDNSIVGAGSTITKDIPEQMLSVERGKQKNLDWKGKWSRDQ